jgi:hypothetical protein
MVTSLAVLTDIIGTANWRDAGLGLKPVFDCGDAIEYAPSGIVAETGELWTTLLGTPTS